MEGLMQAQDKVNDRYSSLSDESKKHYNRIFQLVENQSSGDNGVQEVAALLDANKNDEGIHASMRNVAYGETLLNTALSHSYAMTKMLLEHGANPNQGDMMDGSAPLDHLAEWMEDDEESVEYKKLEELLVEHGASRSAFSQMMEMAQKPQRTDGIAGVFNGILQQSLWQQAQSDQDDDSLGPSDEED
jgi:poly-D-alanine transfer protein DltD